MSSYYLTRDGKPVTGRVHASEFGILGELHRTTSVSMDHALRHEGYAVVGTDADVWPTEKALELSRTARYLFRDHGHDMTFSDEDEEDMTRSSCGACALDGYGATDEGPNYAGWARVYVEAGKRIPEQWADAFAVEVASPDNELYREALARDIRTYGVAGVSVPATVL